FSLSFLDTGSMKTTPLCMTFCQKYTLFHFPLFFFPEGVVVRVTEISHIICHIFMAKNDC
ncbi:hypothetical protein, partial [Gemmiger formicilis]|uniref:hypothetical protein n=1 Tax=Gemmiger formicilis TaxID=745368 RepID=UPI00195CC6E7